MTVANEGSFSESFNVTIYANMTYAANATAIAEFTNVSLNIDSSTTLSLVWNTAGFDSGDGSAYAISAYITPVPGETDLTDNTFIDGTVHILQSHAGGGGRMPYMD